MKSKTKRDEWTKRDTWKLGALIVRTKELLKLKRKPRKSQ